MGTIRKEILTLAPLGALVVTFGFFPGIVLHLISGPADVALGYVTEAQAIAIDPLWVAAGLGLFVAKTPAAEAAA